MDKYKTMEQLAAWGLLFVCLGAILTFIGISILNYNFTISSIGISIVFIGGFMDISACFLTFGWKHYIDTLLGH